MTSLAPALQAVVALFRGPLHNVRFADIDAAGLGNLAAEVEAAAAEVEAQEAKLAELRQALSQKQESLAALAQQALAYARIYAEGDDALTAQLNEITLPRAAKPRKPSLKGAGARGEAEQGAEPAELPAPSEVAPAAAAGREPVSPEVVTANDAAAEPEFAKPGRRKVQRRLARASASGDAV